MSVDLLIQCAGAGSVLIEITRYPDAARREIAGKLPMDVIAKMLGVPDADQDTLAAGMVFALIDVGSTQALTLENPDSGAFIARPARSRDTPRCRGRPRRRAPPALRQA